MIIIGLKILIESSQFKMVTHAKGVELDIVENALRHSQGPIISVGSGAGIYEYQFCKMIPRIKKRLICVDPDPESFQRYPENGKCIKPKYSFVADLIADKPNVIGKCTLLMLWPPPQDEREYFFDIDSVRLLKPYRIIVFYECTGVSGSEELMDFMYRDHKKEGYKIVEEREDLKRQHHYGMYCDTYVYQQTVLVKSVK